MKFCHISDTHSTFPNISKDAEFIIHSGDFFPNFRTWFTGELGLEAKNQELWLLDNIELMKKQLQGRDFLYVLGNHDFLHPEIMEKLLNDNRINAINLTNKSVEYKEYNIYGFPYIPYIEGRWNYEKDIGPMYDEFDVVIDLLNKKKHDILVCHSAPANVLDECRWTNMGSTAIANGIFYKIAKDMQPQHVLFGHIHEACGIVKIDNITFSNAATTQNYLAI